MTRGRAQWDAAAAAALPVWTGDHWEVGGQGLPAGSRVVLQDGKEEVVAPPPEPGPGIGPMWPITGPSDPPLRWSYRWAPSRFELWCMGLSAAFMAVYGPLSTWPAAAHAIAQGAVPFLTALTAMGIGAVALRHAREADEREDR